jgi:hypothetical protein
MLEYVDEIAQHPRYHQVFNTARYLFYVLVGAAFLGVTAVSKQHLADIDTAIKICIGLFLAVRFNPWAKRAVSKESARFDREIAFSGGLILLAATVRAAWPGATSVIPQAGAVL